MKNTWSIFWRIAVLQIAVTIPPLLIVQQADAANDLSVLKWKPSMLFAFMAFALVVIKMRLTNGALSMVWGSRLNASKDFWNDAQRVLLVLYGGLAIFNALAALTLSWEAWLVYKMWVPLFAYVLASAFLGKQLQHASQRSIEVH